MSQNLREVKVYRLDDLELELDQFLRDEFNEKRQPKARKKFYCAVDEVVDTYLEEYSASDALEVMNEHRHIMKMVIELQICWTLLLGK
jgi:hypothetical protein